MIRLIFNWLKKPLTEIPVWLYLLLEFSVPLIVLLLVLQLFR